MSCEALIDADPSSTSFGERSVYTTLPRPVEIWERSGAGAWRSLDRQVDRPSPGESANPAQLTSLLELAFHRQRPCRAALTPGRDAIAAPLPNGSDAAPRAAVVIVDAPAADKDHRLAEALSRESELESQNTQLHAEVFAFAQQVSDDFEELTFLRTLATRLVVTDETLEIGQVVEPGLAELRKMIGAESLYFIRKGVNGVLQIAGHEDASSDPERRKSAAYQVAEAHYGHASHGPCVRNDLAQGDASLRDAGIQQMIMTPIGVGPRSFGWFLAVNRTRAGRALAPSPLLQLIDDEFGTREASLLSTAASLLASHASNLELLREKEHLLISTVRSLVSALDAKDAYTRGHSERVALYSKRIAEALGYDAAAADRLYLAGLLHDIGKIGVSDAILAKPGKLTDEEFAEIKRHPDEGWSILRDLEQLRYVLPGVLHHHEQVGGAGYPDGLAADRIPLDARIMAVADAYDAMTSDRAYRRGMPHYVAVSILRRGVGTQWDGEIVEAFMSVVNEIADIRYGYEQPERVSREAPALAPCCRG